jgi:N-acetylmuramic acid 6-phosphate etherase
MFYVGAGTSGRLGIIDASELPCTFGVAHDRVQAIIAGGPSAVYDAAMGDEDNRANGEKDLFAQNVGALDVVVGITASGRTPYVLGAIEAGKKVGAVTIGICNNPDSALASQADVAIVAHTGPETIEGSTRMKAGTSQKMILNMLSTVIMSRLGYVYKNYMVRMVPNNEKLYARAIHITSKCTGADERVCEKTLCESDWNIAEAIVMIARDVDHATAKRLLEHNQHVVGKVLQENK